MIPSRIRVVASVEVLGATLGVGSVLLGLLHVVGHTSLTEALAPAILFGILGFAGVLLYRGSVAGVWLSLLSQLAQVPAISTAFLTYRAVSPASVDITLNAAWNPGITATVGSSWVFAFARDAHSPTLSLNLLALACFVILYKSRRGLTSG